MFQTLNAWDHFIAQVAAGLISAGLNGLPLHIALTNGSTFDPKVGEFWNHAQFQPFEVAGAGYTANGQALTGVAATRDDTNNRAFITANNPVWDPTTITVDGAVALFWTGSAATSRVVGFQNFAQVSVPNDRFRLLIPATGIYTVG